MILGLAPENGGGDCVPVGGDGEVGVGLVGERGVRIRRDDRAPLTSWRRGHGRALGQGAAEAAALVGERGRVRGEGEHGVQEVLGRGVLVEPPGEVGDGGLEVVAADDRRVQHHRSGMCPGHARLGVGHPFEHLELEAIAGVE